MPETEEICPPVPGGNGPHIRLLTTQKKKEKEHPSHFTTVAKFDKLLSLA